MTSPDHPRGSGGEGARVCGDCGNPEGQFHRLGCSRRIVDDRHQEENVVSASDVPTSTEAGEERARVEIGDEAAERIARAFHAAYEEMAPQHGYETRRESRKLWADVPERNRALMIGTVKRLAATGVIAPAPPEPAPQARAADELAECLSMLVYTICGDNGRMRFSYEGEAGHIEEFEEALDDARKLLARYRQGDTE